MRSTLAAASARCSAERRIASGGASNSAACSRAEWRDHRFDVACVVRRLLAFERQPAVDDPIIHLQSSQRVRVGLQATSTACLFVEALQVRGGPRHVVVYRRKGDAGPHDVNGRHDRSRQRHAELLAIHLHHQPENGGQLRS
ncbi:MAG: hypothetical protein IPM84_14530 [Anaerolineae bacterium]|nr:hypothetical protein [Anaerolineae bacterium]